MAIEVGRDYSKTPDIVCPHCSQELTLGWENFKGSMVVRSNCPQCNGEIFTALFLITEITAVGLRNAILKLAEFYDTEKRKAMSRIIQ